MADIKSKSKGTRNQNSVTETTTGKVGFTATPYPQAEEDDFETVAAKLAKMKREAVSPADYTQVKAGEDQAENLYNERADRGEWLSLAEKLGNAATRIGAAQAGNKAGVDMSKIDYGPGIDWEGRNKRYAGDLDRALSRGKTERSALDKTQETNQRISDKGYEDTREGTKSDFDAKKYVYGQKNDTYQADRRDGESYKKSMALSAAQDSRADARLAAQNSEENRRRTKSESDALFKAQVADLQKQYAEAEKDAEAAAQAAQILKSQPDLSKKSAEKLMSNYPQVMARAGITPEQMTQIEEGSIEKGMIWDSTDPAKRQQLIQENLINPRLEKIKTIRQALDAKLKGASTGSSSSSTESESRSGSDTPPPAPKVTMRHKASGAIRVLSPEDAAKLPKAEFEQVK